MKRVVFDTNTAISGLLWTGAPHRALKLAEEGQIQLIISEALVDEMRDVISRSKFDKPLAHHGKTRQQVIEAYLSMTHVVEPAQVRAAVRRDPDDNMVLACAVGGKADVIVSGDDDLIALHVYEGIPIMTAPHFLAWQRSERPAAP